MVGSILPKGLHHDEYLRWLDKVSDFFLDLTNDQGELIPIIFRPYHENTGNWFWWCQDQCSPEQYKELWIMTVDYMTKEKQVNNLIYAYTPSSLKDESHFLERYPGDDYVDIIGFDFYLLPEKESDGVEAYKAEMTKNLSIVTHYAEKHNKVAIIGETGMEGIPHPTYFTEIVYPLITQYDLAWILFWRNAWESDKPQHHYLPYQEHSSANDFKTFTEKSEILLNNQINQQKQ